METDSPNVHAEQSLLPPQFLARWKGLALGWFSAAPELYARNIAWPRPLLAMLDTGRARAEFGFARHTEHKDIGAGAMGLFNGQIEPRFCKWSCRSVRRIMLDLDAGALSSIGLQDTELAHTGWRQDTEFYDPQIEAVLRCMLREVTAGCPSGALYAQSLSLGLLLRLSQLRGAGASAGMARRERGGLSSSQRRRVEEFIALDLAGDLSLMALADAAGFSPAQFTRLFRNSYGQSPHRYVLLKRVERAHALIQSGHLSLAAIAQACGFSGQSHMTSVFAKELGTSPGTILRTSKFNH